MEPEMATLQDFEPLKPAERKLLDVARTGKQCSFERTRPEAPSVANEIRADFLRFLALGGAPDAPVHEGGLRVQGAYIDGAVNLDGAKNVRPLWIQGCFISGDFTFSDAETKVVSLDRTAVSTIRGDGVAVDGSLLLRGALIDGSLQLFGAEIGGSLSCTDCTIKGKRWRSQRLAADLATVAIGGNVEFRGGFSAGGLILLDDSEIGGAFDCSGAKFSAGVGEARSQPPSRWDRADRALKAHRLKVSGSLYLRDCDSDGEVSFSGAQIGGDLDCRNGHFRSAEQGDSTAVRFTRIELTGNIYFSKGFTADGKVQLNGARIRGNIDCRGGVFSVPANLTSRDFAAPDEAFSEDAMSLVNAEVMGALFMAPIEGKNGEAAEFNGSLDLKSAHVHVLVDDERSWPRLGGPIRNVIHLDGFTYDRFAGIAPIDAHIRMKWLNCQPKAHLGHDFRPQPFEQLIKVLKAMGHPEEARRLAIERQGFLIRRRIAGWRKGPRGAVRALAALVSALTVGLLIGHGYRPLRVLAIMALVGFACGFYFKLAAEAGVFAPRDAQVFLQPDFEKCRPHAGGNWTTCAAAVGEKFAEYPQFNPWVYSFNVLFPVVDLYQEKSWVPMQKEVRFELADGVVIEVPSWGTKALVWAELVFGGVASLLAVAAFSGLVKTD
jgi:hypothetical protein